MLILHFYYEHFFRLIKLCVFPVVLTLDGSRYNKVFFFSMQHSRETFLSVGEIYSVDHCSRDVRKLIKLNILTGVFTMRHLDCVQSLLLDNERTCLKVIRELFCFNIKMM